MASSPIVSVTVKTEGLKQLGDPALIQNAQRVMIQAAVDVFLPRAKGEAPRRTERSQAGIRGILDRVESEWVGRIRAMGPAWYLNILAKGAKPHPIAVFRAKSRRGRSQSPFAEFLVPGGMVIQTRRRGSFRALRFSAGGQKIFRRGVSHPGARRNPWLDRAAASGAGAAGDAADRVLQAALHAAT